MCDDSLHIYTTKNFKTPALVAHQNQYIYCVVKIIQILFNYSLNNLFVRLNYNILI